MKKLSICLMLALGSSNLLFAQEVDKNAEGKNVHGSEVKTGATETPSGEEKGKIVSELAKSKSEGKVENRADAEIKNSGGDKGKSKSVEAKNKGKKESAEEKEVNSSTKENHGQDVKAVATDENLSGMIQRNKKIICSTKNMTKGKA